MSKFVSLEEYVQTEQTPSDPTVDLTYASIEESPLSNQALATVQSATDAVDQYEKVVQVASKDELTEVGLEMLQINLENIYAKVGLERPASLAVENYNQLRVALEEEQKGFFTRVWEAIKKFFSTIWNWITGLFKSKEEQAKSTEQKVEEVKKEAEETDELAEEAKEAGKALAHATTPEQTAVVINEKLKPLMEKAKQRAIKKLKKRVKLKNGRTIAAEDAGFPTDNENAKFMADVLFGREPIIFQDPDLGKIFGDKDQSIVINDLEAQFEIIEHFESDIKKALSNSGLFNSDFKSKVTAESFKSVTDGVVEDLIKPMEYKGFKLDVGGNLTKFIVPTEEISIEVSRNGPIRGAVDKFKSRADTIGKAAKGLEHLMADVIKNINDYTQSVKVDMKSEDKELADQAKLIKSKINLVNGLLRLVFVFSNEQIKFSNNLLEFISEYRNTIAFMAREYAYFLSKKS